MDKNLNPNKIAVIGAGGVGATTAYALMVQGVGSEIVLIDVNKEKAEGEAMDLRHGASFVNPVDIYAGDYKDLADAKLIVITAGAAQKPGESRLDLVKKNTGIFKNIISSITEYNQEGILLVVTNPVDILTYLSYKLSGFPANRVIGSGTVLDSSRFRSLLSKNCNIAASNVHGYIIGEHGDSEVPVWSLTNIAGTKIENYCPICNKGCDEHDLEEISDQVKNAAYEIIDKKGATFYAVALGVARIARAILRDENAVLTVSSLMEGYYGVENMSLSLPTIINSKGIERVLELPLSEKEEKEFKDSAQHLKENIKELDI
ncbi:L-lactate dehydrogenase [Halanaerobium saccharolyticum]|uniref:L-lactate dehydrogenase n=1 Tax=Halanaerobium saccharolyticum TaxID=43595 RepID=A0A4R7Z6Q1_9FIRM|nr:L-lactate dehydrogenase [Halanaerobium saccharolyticum]RAK11210.1 L-lactate dehydrogenase [Halanaerobium saccharolyticum]TDW07061.1 L-lactate dehydrogenase [Halanaerobium saccharolyticum]TDX63826.1 L-lactate dehydrogenase [Halanaerobium saccharolyticum]